jgi:type II secretory pathway pseudopilin PulG
MKNNKRKGVTFIALLATIAIAVIILSTVVVAYQSIINNTKKSEFAREIYTLRNLILDYDFMNSSYPIEDEISVNLNNINVDSQIQFSSEPGYSTNSIVLNKVNLAEAGAEKIIRGTTKYGSNDFYAFSSITKKLYYIQGEEIGTNTYYTLTDELYKIISINDID